jgi:hypothetical protein
MMGNCEIHRGTHVSQVNIVKMEDQSGFHAKFTANDYRHQHTKVMDVHNKTTCGRGCSLFMQPRLQDYLACYRL